MESPSMAEVGPPVILSLGIAGYCSVSRPQGASARAQKVWQGIGTLYVRDRLCPGNQSPRR